MDALLNALFTPEAGLVGLFLASFLAATLLPGGSEAVLLGLLSMHPELHWPALGLATLGNTLGSLSSYALARLLPDKIGQPPAPLPPQGLPSVAEEGGDYGSPCLRQGSTRFTVFGLRRLCAKKPGGKHAALVQHWGAPVLILAWLPLIGDLLCVAAGWLRLPWLPCTLWLALGKGLRYLALVEGWRLLG